MGYSRPEVATALGTLARGFFEQYAATQGKARWADKTPDYVDCLPELWELFGPDARFLLMVRDGMDVAFSLADPHRHYPAIDVAVRQAGGNVPVGAGRYWSEQSEKIESFRQAHRDACFEIRYEQLTDDPETVLRRVFGFVGEGWEDTVLDYNRSPHHAGFEDPDVRRKRRIERNSGRYKVWPPAVQEAVREACAPMLTRLGYG
jgi:Sulfotransferase family